MNVLVSIVTWNSAEVIERCIESVFCQTYQQKQVVVVDNASRDTTLEILTRLQNMYGFALIKNDQNKGFCGGHNYSIENFESDYVLLVNPDVVMSPAYLEKALETFTGEPDRVGTVCGLLVQKLGDPQTTIDSTGLEFKPSGVLSMINHGARLSELSLVKQDVFGSDGALPLYRRDMIEDVSIDGHFFDEMFFAHKEDWDVSWRSQHRGWRTVFNPACIAEHPRHFKPKSLSLRRLVQSDIKVHSVKNQLILLLKNETLSGFLGNFFSIIGRQFGIFFYIVLLERSSLQAYGFVMRNFSKIWQNREYIQSRRIKKRRR